MKNKTVIDMTYLAVLVSLMIIMGVVPFLGFIPTGIGSVTILHIPVIIAVLYFDTKFAVSAGAAFGVISWAISLIRPSGVMDFFFQNPLISVVPRIVFALLAALLYISLKNVFKNDYVRSVVTAVIGSFIHSILVLGMIAIIYYEQVSEAGTFAAAIKVAVGTLTTFSVLEAIAAGLIAPPIARALKIANRKIDPDFNWENE
jgi:uncharacterized membrane protein